MDKHDILILGASGRTGQQLIKTFYNQYFHCCRIHTFCRKVDRIPSELRVLCSSTIEGDVTNVEDIITALDDSDADFVIVAVGEETDEVSTVRTECAINLGGVLKSLPEYEDIRVVAISCCGAGEQGKCHLDQKIRTCLHPEMRSAMIDHRGQEMVLLDSIGDRTMIVRANELVDNHPTGNIRMYTLNERCPSHTIDRQDLAVFIASQCVDGDGTIHIASVVSSGTGRSKRAAMPVRRIAKCQVGKCKEQLGNLDHRIRAIKDNLEVKIRRIKGGMMNKKNQQQKKENNNNISSSNNNKDTTQEELSIMNDDSDEMIVDEQHHRCKKDQESACSIGTTVTHHQDYHYDHDDEHDHEYSYSHRHNKILSGTTPSHADVQ